MKERGEMRIGEGVINVLAVGEFFKENRAACVLLMVHQWLQLLHNVAELF